MDRTLEKNASGACNVRQSTKVASGLLPEYSRERFCTIPQSNQVKAQNVRVFMLSHDDIPLWLNEIQEPVFKDRISDESSHRSENEKLTMVHALVSLFFWSTERARFRAMRSYTHATQRSPSPPPNFWFLAPFPILPNSLISQISGTWSCVRSKATHARTCSPTDGQGTPA
jgi:hypothetical protein